MTRNPTALASAVRRSSYVTKVFIPSVCHAVFSGDVDWPGRRAIL